MNLLSYFVGILGCDCGNEKQKSMIKLKVLDKYFGGEERAIRITHTRSWEKARKPPCTRILSLSLSLSLYIYIYIYVCVCVKKIHQHPTPHLAALPCCKIKVYPPDFKHTTRQKIA